MTHYEERLHRDLNAIKQQVASVGRVVESAIGEAMRALLGRDHDLATRIVLGDLEVNRQTREIDRLCHVFVARHLPGAGHLRYVSSVLRLSIALERIGDYAVTICRSAVQLSEAPPVTVARDLDMTADLARRSLEEALLAFNELNADRARTAIALSAQFASTFDKVFADLLDEGEKRTRPINDLFLMLASFNRLERVIHQAKNICEEAIFADTGQTKKPKTFRILFLDERDAHRARLAEAFARKGWPRGGTYESAGWAPASATPAVITSFAERHGYDLSPRVPRDFDSIRLQDYDMVVALGRPARERITKIPFHTLVLWWDIESPGEQPDTDALERLHRSLTQRISDLMEKLYGKGAV